MKKLVEGEVSGLFHVAALALCPWPKRTGGGSADPSGEVRPQVGGAARDTVSAEIKFIDNNNNDNNNIIIIIIIIIYIYI